MTCRERAGQVRDRYEEILATGAGVTAIGTGGKRYAKAFIEDERVPFSVLLDEDGTAAEIVGMKSTSAIGLLSPRQITAGIRARMSGKRQHNAGRRPFQLGATLVIAPGDVLRHADFEDFAGDHADLDEVIAAIG
ncbi:MAG: peroxiredoxin-like family protein [Acidimicrobiia bacterium]